MAFLWGEGCGVFVGGGLWGFCGEGGLGEVFEVMEGGFVKVFV